MKTKNTLFLEVMSAIFLVLAAFGLFVLFISLVSCCPKVNKEVFGTMSIETNDTLKHIQPIVWERKCDILKHYFDGKEYVIKISGDSAYFKANDTWYKYKESDDYLLFQNDKGFTVFYKK